MPKTLEAIIHFLDQHALGIQALAALITLLLTAILGWATWRYAGSLVQNVTVAGGP